MSYEKREHKEKQKKLGPQRTIIWTQIIPFHVQTRANVGQPLSEEDMRIMKGLGSQTRACLWPLGFLFIFVAQRANGRLAMSKKARAGVGNEGRARAEEAI